MAIGLGFLLVGFFGAGVPIWGIPLLMMPTYIGSNLFNTANNALVMNTLQENRSFASGMLETTRQMGHTVGTTISATVLGLSLPVAIELLPSMQAQAHYRDGFQMAALTVVGIIVSGSLVAIFQRFPSVDRQPRPPEAAPRAGGATPAPQAGDDD